MSLNSIQLRQIDSDDIPFTQIGVGDSEQTFYAPLPDWMPTEEEVKQALEDRRRDRAREYAAALSPKVR